MTKRFNHIYVAVVSRLLVVCIGLTNSSFPARTPITDLDAKAHARTSVPARVPLASGDVLPGLNREELLETEHVPNYLRALAAYPGGADAFAHLFRTVLYSGQLDPEVKMAMGLRVAQTYSAPYVAAHAERLLRVTP